LQRAKAELADLVERLPGDRLGLVVFAGRPILRAPLTADHGFLRETLDEVDVQNIGRGGTRIGDALREALQAMPHTPGRDRAIVLVSDGEDHESAPLEAAQLAAAEEIKIFTVGLGDANRGARIPVPTGAGQQGFLKYEGREVWSRLNEELLQEIARTTGGAYFHLGGGTRGLERLYEEHLAGLARTETAEEIFRRYPDRFQWFLGLGMVLILIELVTPAHRRWSASESNMAGPR
jgi:Ca-activated chloride channel family protein